MTVDLTPRQRSLLTGAAIASGVGIILHINLFFVFLPGDDAPPRKPRRIP